MQPLPLEEQLRNQRDNTPPSGFTHQHRRLIAPRLDSMKQRVTTVASLFSSPSMLAKCEASRSGVGAYILKRSARIEARSRRRRTPREAVLHACELATAAANENKRRVGSRDVRFKQPIAGHRHRQHHPGAPATALIALHRNFSSFALPVPLHHGRIVT